MRRVSILAGIGIMALAQSSFGADGRLEALGPLRLGMSDEEFRKLFGDKPHTLELGTGPFAAKYQVGGHQNTEKRFDSFFLFLNEEINTSRVGVAEDAQEKCGLKFLLLRSFVRNSYGLPDNTDMIYGKTVSSWSFPDKSYIGISSRMTASMCITSLSFGRYNPEGLTLHIPEKP